MEEKHITKLLHMNDSSFVYTMKKKEALVVDIIIASQVSFHAEVKINMEAKGGIATIRVFVLPTKRAGITISTYQKHIAPNTKSDMVVKTLLVDASTVSFQGNVYIGKDAKKSDAIQKNINLVVGDGGVVTTAPTLEILNNDVRCAHGVTTGTIPSDAVWYMETRGISEHVAKTLYIDGYIHDSMSGIQDNFIKDVIYNQMESHI